MPKKSVKSVKSDKPKVKGVGGWLLFFTIIFIISLIAQVTSGIYSIFVDFSYMSLIYFIISVFLSVALLVFIFNEKKSSVKNIILVLWYSFVIDSLYTLFNSSVDFAKISGSLDAATLIITIILQGIITFLLVLYFKKSIRVKNTFVK